MCSESNLEVRELNSDWSNHIFVTMDIERRKSVSPRIKSLLILRKRFLVVF